MADKTLEEYQAAEYSDVMATFEFTCEYGDVVSHKSSEAVALKPGCRLHFLRYGLFEKSSKTDGGHYYAGPREGEGGGYYTSEVECIHPEMPDLTKFYTARTRLNQGYLYLINADEPNKHFEFEVGESGELSTVTWSKNKDDSGEKFLDVRKSDGDRRHYKIVSRGRMFWVAYSPYQWETEYHYKMCTDAQLRKKRMVLIDASGIIKGTEDADSNVVPYTEVRTSFDRSDAYYTWYRNHLKMIHENENEGDDVYTDLFVTLDDPIGAANDVAGVLNSKYNRLGAIIESIQTGNDEEKIFQRLQKERVFNRMEEDEVKEEADPTEREIQANGLFSSALTLYQFLYNNPEIEEEYGGTTDKEKLVRVLAVAERKEQRKKITAYRSEFGRYLSSSYYKKHFSDFQEGGVQGLHEGKDILLTHLVLLAVQPHDLDRHLSLKVDYEGNHDVWAAFFEEISTKDSDFDKILAKKIELENIQQSILNAKNGFKLSRRLVKCLNSASGAFAKHAVRTVDATIIIKYVMAFEYRGEAIIEVNVHRTDKLPSGEWRVNRDKMIESGQAVPTRTGGVYGSSTDAIWIRTGQGIKKTQEIAANGRIKLMIKAQGDKSERMMKAVLNHPRFKVFIAGMELINAGMNFKKFTNEKNSKNTLNLIGSIAHASSASAAYIEAKMKVGSLKAGDKTIQGVGKIYRFTGFLGSGISVAMSIWDAVESYRTRDYDASLAWSLTATVAGILLVEGIYFYAFGAVLFGFWPVLICNILFFGGMFLAISLTDSPLEKFFKNNVFNSESGTLLNSPGAPYWYVRGMIDEKSRLVPEKFAFWRDLQQASKDLYDLLIGYQVSHDILAHHQVVRGKGFKERLKDTFTDFSGANFNVVSEIKLTVRLRNFLYNTSRFDYVLKLFTKGVAQPSSDDVILDVCAKLLETDNLGIDILNIYYEIPQYVKYKCSLSAEFIFISRTVVNEDLSQYWPRQNGQDRYLGYKISATNQREVHHTFSGGDKPLFYLHNDQLLESAINIVFGNHIRVGTETELFDHTTWNK